MASRHAKVLYRQAFGVAVLAGVIVTQSALAPRSATSRFDSLRQQYDPEVVAGLVKQAQQAGIAPTAEDIVGVLEFRQSCFLLAQMVKTGGTRMAEPMIASLAERGQKEAAVIFEEQLLGPAMSGNMAPAQSFLDRECDPTQDLSKPVRTE